MNAASIGAPRPTLVFLHHFGGSTRSWDRVIDLLAKEYQTLALDLPGFGAEANAPGPYTVASYADAVEDAVRAHDLADYVLIGHSMGGKVALAVAARLPAGLRALILLAPSPPTPEPIDEAMRTKLIAGWGHYGPASEMLARVTACPLPGELRERIVADMMASGKCAWEAWLRHGSREDISASMALVTSPVTILSGSRDSVLPTELIKREVVDRLARACLIAVPGAGHLLPLEAPDAVAASIQRSVLHSVRNGRKSGYSVKRKDRYLVMLG